MTKPYVLTDEEVLEIRAMKEFDGVSRKEILEAYPHITPEYLRKLLDYSIRSKLIPRSGVANKKRA